MYNEELKMWANEQVLKHGINTLNAIPLVYWEANATKKEEKEGLGHGVSYHIYNFKDGTHHYLKNKLNIGDGTDYRKPELIEKFGKDIVVYKADSKYYISKFLIKPVDDGAIMVQSVKFAPKKPFKKDYGVKRDFHKSNNNSTLADTVMFLLKDKTFIRIDNYQKLFTGYGSPEYYMDHNDVYKSCVPDLVNDFNLENISNFPYKGGGFGVYGESFSSMVKNSLGDNFRRFYVLGGTTIADISNIWMLREIIGYKEVSLPNSKRQKIINELDERLCNINSDDFEILNKSKDNGEALSGFHYSNEEEFANKVAYLDKTPDGNIAIRYFMEMKTDNGEFIGSEEVLRLYVDQNGFVGAKKRFDGTWAAVNATKDASNWNADRFFMKKDLFNESMKNIIYYIKDILMNSEKPGYTLYSVLRYPIIESAIKTGISFETKYYCENALDALKHKVGGINTGEKNLKKALGLNAHQIEYLKNNPQSSMIRDIKRLFMDNREYGRDEYYSIADMDNDYFDFVLDKLRRLSFLDSSKTNIYSDKPEYHHNVEDISEITGVSYGLENIFRRMKSIYSMDTIMSEKTEKFLEMLFSTYQKLLKEARRDARNRGQYYRYVSSLDYMSSPVSIYMDYLSLAEMVDDKRIAPPTLSSFEELKDAHDSLTIIINNKRSEFEFKKFEAAKENGNWDKYLYEDEKFSIIYPEAPGDIVAEGRSLSHCVASFVNAVSRGETTILFLREKDNIDKSLLTIEVVDDTVRQAHGFANCTLASMESGHIGINSFFDNWVKDKKLKTNNIDRMLCVGR